MRLWRKAQTKQQGRSRHVQEQPKIRGERREAEKGAKLTWVAAVSLLDYVCAQHTDGIDCLELLHFADMSD